VLSRIELATWDAYIGIGSPIFTAITKGVFTMAEVLGTSTAPATAGVTGRSTQFNGVLGESTADGHAGVAGVNDTGTGNGVYGRSALGDGVLGVATGDGKSGVAGVNDDGTGNGVYGRSAKGDGVVGVATANGKSGVAGVNEGDGGVGIYGRGQRLAGLFDGNVDIIGSLSVEGLDIKDWLNRIETLERYVLELKSKAAEAAGGESGGLLIGEGFAPHAGPNLSIRWRKQPPQQTRDYVIELSAAGCAPNESVEFLIDVTPYGAELELLVVATANAGGFAFSGPHTMALHSRLYAQAVGARSGPTRIIEFSPTGK
jgi:hypothetical protein